MEREDVPTGDMFSVVLHCRKGLLWSSDGACPRLIFMYARCCGMSTGKCRVGGDGQLLRIVESSRCGRRSPARQPAGPGGGDVTAGFPPGGPPPPAGGRPPPGAGPPPPGGGPP